MAISSQATMLTPPYLASELGSGNTPEPIMLPTTGRWPSTDPAPDGAACGHCEACLLRLKGFDEAGVADPARYQAAHA